MNNDSVSATDAEVNAVLDILEPELPSFMTDAAQAEARARAREANRGRATRIVLAVKTAGMKGGE